MDRQTVTAWLASRHPGTYSFPPSPKKFLHSFLGCLKNSRYRFKSFIFFRKKLRSFDGFDQMSAFWSMFWFKPFRNFLRKIAIFRNFDHWSEILSLSAGWPISQDVCPPLIATLCVFCGEQRRRKKISAHLPKEEACTVSWRIRIFNCIEEVPRFFFSIEFNPTFQISNYLQFNCTPYTI
jgi:hypothetical protein